MASIIENDNAATSGHPDDPVPECPNSRSAAADTKRAALKATGTMSLSKKIDPETKVARAGARWGDRPNGVKPSAAAVDKPLGHAADGAVEGGAPTRVRKSNAEIADGVTTTALKSPAPRAARVDAAGPGAAGQPRGLNKTGVARQRAPAPGNAVSTPKGEFVRGRKAAGERSTAATGAVKPPKRPARGGHATAATKSKGADRGLS